jgi:FkbM family methyltransferase
MLPKNLQVPGKYWYGWLRGTLEPEMTLLQCLVRKEGHVIDVGGNRGVYAYKLWKLGCRVEVFEPNPACCDVLNAWLRDKPMVKLHPVALSSRTGNASLHIPVDAAGVEHDASASLEHEDFASARNREVRLKTLDSYEYEDIAFIKIDVEGHEQNVLDGASGTIEKSKPALLIEIEQRHNKEPVARIFESIKAMGYRGFFLDQGEIKALDDFHLGRDQPVEQFGNPNARYINNFLFLHNARIQRGEYAALEAGGA